MREFLLAAAGLSAAAWIAYFQMASRLGIYQDDVWMYHIVRFTRDGVLREAFDFSRAHAGEGRPMAQTVMVLLTWIGSQLDGVTGLYLVTWALLSIVTGLVYATLRHFFSAPASFLAAAFFVLFPADAAKFFAVSSLGWFGAIIFWSAALLLVKGRTYLAALALAATFLMSEAYILPGLLLPLLLLADGGRDPRAALRAGLRFLAAYGVLVVPAAAWRLAYAPGRAAGALEQFDRFTLLKRMIGSMYFGMDASFAAAWGRIVTLLDYGNSVAWTAVALVFALLAIVAARLARDDREQREHARQPAGGRVIEAGLLPAPAPRLRWIAAFGVLAWAASYPLYGLYPPRFPPIILIGKLSNVHAQAAIGMTLLFAAVLHAIEARNRGAARALRWRPLAAAYLALVAGYFVVIQQRYVEDWHHQLSFWKQLPGAIPDLKPETLVVVEPFGEEITRLEGGSSFDWTLPYLFGFMWNLPAEWAREPMVINRGFFDSTKRIHDGRVDIVGYPTHPTRSFALRDVVRVHVEDGKFFVAPADGAPAAGAAQGAGYSLFDEALVQPSRFARGELQLRAAREAQGVIVANDFSSAEWRHGIALAGTLGKGGRGFYFVIDNAGANPVRKGGTVRFSATGRARVLEVAVQPQGGRYAVFVTVDRDLDPDRDGFPNAIHVLP